MAEDADNGASGAPIRSCRFCGSPLSPGATFCVNCELFQHRWGLRGKSRSAYISLFSALVATLALAYNSVKDRDPNAGLSQDADPRVAGLKCYTDLALITITNKGRRAMALGGGTVHASGLHGDESRKPMKRALDLDPQDTVVKDLETKTVRMYFALDSGARHAFPLQDPDPKLAGYPCAYTFSIDYYSFKGDDKKKLASVPACSCQSIDFKNRRSEPQPSASAAAGDK